MNNNKIINLIEVIIILTILICLNISCQNQDSVERTHGTDYCKPIYQYPYEYYGFRQNYMNHNGHDYKAPEGTGVVAVLDGQVIYSGNYSGFGSTYPSTPGGAIVIMHINDNDDYFYAIYGHLDSLVPSIGDYVSKGSILGCLNGYTNNGNYSPHLHFGIFTGNTFPTSAWGYSDLEGWVQPEIYLDTYCGNMIDCSTN